MTFLGAIPGVAQQYFGMITSGDPSSMIIGAIVLLGLVVFLVKRIRIWIKAIIYTQF